MEMLTEIYYTIKHICVVNKKILCQETKTKKYIISANKLDRKDRQICFHPGFTGQGSDFNSACLKITIQSLG